VPPEKTNNCKTKLMKKMNQILFAAVIATTISLASQANAQYKINEHDGIAASPRLRQQLNEQKASATAAAIASKNHPTTTVASAGYRVTENDGIAASPKTRQVLNEQSRRSTAVQSSTAVASAGYKATGPDGITASPRLRQQLNERPVTIMVAPVK
jgi:hypothetical protein